MFFLNFNIFLYVNIMFSFTTYTVYCLVANSERVSFAVNKIEEFFIV